MARKRAVQGTQRGRGRPACFTRLAPHPRPPLAQCAMFIFQNIMTSLEIPLFDHDDTSYLLLGKAFIAANYLTVREGMVILRLQTFKTDILACLTRCSSLRRATPPAPRHTSQHHLSFGKAHNQHEVKMERAGDDLKCRSFKRSGEIFDFVIFFFILRSCISSLLPLSAGTEQRSRTTSKYLFFKPVFLTSLQPASACPSLPQLQHYYHHQQQSLPPQTQPRSPSVIAV